MRSEQRDRAERFARWLSYAVLIAVAVCDIIPIIVLAMIRLMMEPNAPRGEVPAGYPPFDTQLWLAWIPVVLLLALVIVTIPLPYRRTRGMGRITILVVVLLVFVASVARIAGELGLPGVASAGTSAIPAVILAIGAVHLLRIIAGGLGILPRRWRVYLDDAGNPEPDRRG